MSSAPDRLEEYRRRRDFDATPEPSGETRAAARGDRLLYVVQEHHARRLHYDLRLEWRGVLLSWAVTKRPKGEPGERRLAVQTEDHPLDYADFAGEIPSGYGKGQVAIWDRGWWVPAEEDVAGALKRGKLSFRIEGERLRGAFTLARMRRKKGESRDNWLFIKKKAEPADRAPRRSSAKAPARPEARARSRAKPPGFAPPMLATLADAPPEGGGWIHELKHDGYRVIAAIGGGEARLYSRSGKDWSDRFGALPEAFAALRATDALVDGEIVAAGKDGKPDFGALQRALSEGGALSAYCFDLLRLDGEDLRSEPLGERRARLRALLADAPAELRYSDSVEGDGAAVLKAACRLGAEGVVSKRLDSRYVSRRSRLWMKSKCIRREEAVIGGWRRSTATGRPFASLLVGAWDGDRLVYRGRVGTGFDTATAERLARLMAPLTRKTPPFADLPAEAARDAVWVTPKLVAELRFTERTSAGLYRHPTFLGLREDKPSREVREEAEQRAPEQNARKQDPPEQGEATMRLTNADKVLFPQAGYTKGRLLEHFETVAELMLPLVIDRPLTLVRCPDGRDGECFFQKHLPKGAGAGLKSWRRGAKTYMRIEDIEGLRAAAQLGALELHIGGARVSAPDKPERLVIDLDPHEDVGFDTVKDAARELRDVLSAAGLESFPLLTGGKGVHVIAPLVAETAWPEVKAFAKKVARAMAAARPERYVATASKAARKGRIYLDWLRNDEAATAIAPFSSRARPGGPAATPVAWRELGRIKRSDAYDLDALARRLKRLSSDPWESYEAARRPLAPGLAEAVEDAI